MCAPWLVSLTAVATTVFTDGACLGNPGPGGWAWAVPDGPFASGPDERTTNQRMEIRAALEAATSLEGPLEIVSDSTYVVNCFRDRWWEGWVERGWVNKAKKPVANQDLWKPLIEEYRSSPGRLTFRWVKGHSNDPMNDLVDRLAVDAARTQAGRSGTGRPDDDVKRSHRVVVTGSGEVPTAKLVEVLAAKRQLHPDLVVLTGEAWGADAATQAGVPHTMVPSPVRSWPGLRADEAVVVWDGDDAAIGKLVRSLQDHLGEEDVWVLHP